MKNVFITGAGGFIGSHIAGLFADKGVTVYALVHENMCSYFQAISRKENVKVIRGDITDSVDVENKLKALNINYFIHCAAYASDVGKRNKFLKCNYQAVIELAEICLKMNVERFVYVSTTDVYGLKDFNGENEDELPLGVTVKNCYPEYKIKSEQWLKLNMPPENFSIVRPAAVWGEGDHTLTPRVISYLQSFPVIVHFGKWHGRNRWPLAHVDNVAKATYAAAVLPEAGGQAVNVLDDEWTSVSDFYHIIRDVFLPGKKLREISLPFSLAYLPAYISSGVSNALGRKTPLFDPSLYALYTIASNLDFNNRRFKAYLESSGQDITTRDEGFNSIKSSAVDK
jgi:nucleoside-diphosphate-sugar epimerase